MNSTLCIGTKIPKIVNSYILEDYRENITNTGWRISFSYIFQLTPLFYLGLDHA